MSVDPFTGVVGLGRALRERRVSSVELAGMYLERLAKIGSEHRAVVRLLSDSALQQAKSADQRLAKGTPRGPLDGIPFGIKDMFATKGVPTSWGSPAHAGQVFSFDASVVKKLRNSGAVLIAKLALIELAGGGNYNMPGASATGACLSAHDKARWAGGSSSGSGASTALGLVGFSLGSETSGSITCPCAFNGASGIRPTYGRVSRYGAMPLCWTLDKVGPICRSIEDAGIILRAIAGHDPNDPTTARDTLSLRMSGSKPVIGLLREDFKGNLASACERAYADALLIFRRLGWRTAQVTYPDLPYDLAVQIIVNAEGASAHERFILSERLGLLPDKDQMAGLAASLLTPATDYLWAMRLRTEALRANAVWEKCDAIFTPVFYHAAPPATGKFGDTWKNMGGDAGPANLLGWPAAAFPIGMDEPLFPSEFGSSAPASRAGAESRPGRAPIGGQFIGPAFGENIVWRLGVRFQRETAHHLATPK